MLHFSDLCKKHNYDFVITQHGYGGMHMKDAGMCFIEDVLKTKPQYCFLDWFSTQYAPSDIEDIKDYLDNFRYQFLSNNCQIIFLFFGGQKKHTTYRMSMYNNLIKYALNYNIPYINIYDKIKNMKEEDLNFLFRDSVHTTESGSILYASEIYNNFINNILNKHINNNDLTKNKFAYIKKLLLENKDILEFIKIKGCGGIVGIHQIIGPHSGILNIDADSVTSKLNLWDCWCYYERKSIKIQQDFNDYINIYISQEDFDRKNCKQEANWNVKKIIKPVDYLYYIGDIADINLC